MWHDPQADTSDLHPVTPAVREVLDLLGLHIAQPEKETYP